MAYRAVANLREVSVAELTAACPAAARGARTRQPAAQLERWRILRDLLVDAWVNRDAPTEELLERHLGVLSRLEADLIARMFHNVRRSFPVPDSAEIDLEGRRFWFDAEELGATVPASVTFSINTDEGTEHVRLKTGRSRTTDAEAAVLWSAAEDGETFVDLMASTGEVEEIAAPPDPEALLTDLLEEHSQRGSGVRPGPACVWCRRAATCGAFPSDRPVSSRARTVNVTKTDVEALESCHRRVAWRRVHGVPRDDGEEIDMGSSLGQGRLFHALVGAAEGADDPRAAVDTFLAGVPPSEVAELRLMWENHRRLIDEEGLAVRQTEFPVGITLIEGEGAEAVGTSVIAFLDLTARDATGAPVAIELKTGNPTDHVIEDDIYAVGLRRWIGPDTPAVIHRHYVRWDPPTCEVVALGPGEVEAAAERLRRRVRPIHDWDWDDPLQPAYAEGPWCNGCEFRLTCRAYR